MKSNLLINKINSIQNEYKNLLTVLLPKLKSSNAPEALDEINLFWLRHIEEVKLYLKYWFPGENSYVFTAVTYLDFYNKEHLPFLLIGDKHVLDDPLGKYSEIHNKMSKGKNSEFLYRQIATIAEDNINLLENLNSKILVLPLRLLSQSNSDDTLYKVGERVFISLFNNIESLEDYFLKCVTIDDIIELSHKNIENVLLFSEDDNTELPLKKRFEIALKDFDYMLDLEKSDAYNFYILVFGYIQQAIDIMFSCLEYDCIPFIRNPVSFHYISIISNNYSDISKINAMLFRMSIAFIIYQCYDKEKLSSVPLEEYLSIIQEHDFNNKIFQELNNQGINQKNYLENDISPIIADELKALYEKIDAQS